MLRRDVAGNDPGALLSNTLSLFGRAKQGTDKEMLPRVVSHRRP
jgi:hypothetical protein